MSYNLDSLTDIFPIADFIADSLGELAEVLVHDVRDLECSIVYIRNGHLSGRKIGDGATDVALRLIKEGRYGEKDYVANYGGKSLGKRSFRSSTYFVKDRSNTLIGLLCVNIDVTNMRELISSLEILCTGKTGSAELGADSLVALEENLQGNPQDTVQRMTRAVIAALNVEPKKMTKQEKLRVIEALNNDGAFLMKGAVNTVATELEISIPTAYRYLQEIKACG